MSKRTTTSLTKQLQQAQETAALVLDETPDDVALLQELTTGTSPNDTSAQEYLEWENPDHQNLIKRLRYLEERSVTLLNQLPLLEQKIALAALTPARTFKDIGERAGCTPATAAKHLKNNTAIRDFIEVAHARRSLNAEPSRGYRLQLAWRIALRTEHANPKVALSALQLIAHQSGELQRNEDRAPQAPTIVLAQFNTEIHNNTTAPPPANSAQQPIDGEFTTIDVEVPAQ